MSVSVFSQFAIRNPQSAIFSLRLHFSRQSPPDKLNYFQTRGLGLLGQVHLVDGGAKDADQGRSGFRVEGVEVRLLRFRVRIGSVRARRRQFWIGRKLFVIEAIPGDTSSRSHRLRPRRRRTGTRSTNC